jgi:hypothetical protein
MKIPNYIYMQLGSPVNSLNPLIMKIPRQLSKLSSRYPEMSSNVSRFPDKPSLVCLPYIFAVAPSSRSKSKSMGLMNNNKAEGRDGGKL